MCRQRFFLLSFFGVLWGCGLLPSCGFLNEDSGFLSRSGGGVPDGSGTGRIPSLSSRIGSSPSLSKERCENNKSCKNTCEEIYENISTFKKCYKLSIGEVADMQKLFRALTEEDTTEQFKLLNNTTAKTLENYLEMGLDGFNEQVVVEIEGHDDSGENYEQILKWLVDKKNMTKALSRKDTDNEVLKTLLQNYADEAGSPACASSPATCPTTSSGRANICSHKCGGSSGQARNIYLDSSDNLKSGVCTTPASTGSTCTTWSADEEVAEVEDSQLLKALSFVDHGAADDVDNFFAYSSSNKPNQEAFVLAHELLEEACSNDDRQEADDCMIYFYCWLGKATGENAGIIPTGQMIEDEIDRDVLRGVKAPGAVSPCGW